MKPKLCAYCGTKFVPVRAMQAVCSAVCAGRKVKADKARNARELRERKAAMKTRREWIAEAQREVNRYCRLRDIAAGKGCISCGAPYRGAYGGAFDAGHFRSVGSAPHLRFFTSQIRLQCVRCNRHLGGNVVEFRRGLVAERGSEWVERIEAMQGVAKWSVQWLERLKKVAAKKARRLEKRLEGRE